MYSTCVFFVVLAAFISNSLAARPFDDIVLSDFNRTYNIANETYTFRLYPIFQVPLQLSRHAIYTATTDVVTGKVKRALLQNKESLYELAPEDHAVLAQYMEVPSYVKVNTKKRSLPADSNGYRVIPLAKRATVLYAPAEPGLKREVNQNGVQIGTKFCLHIPFFTTCDNSQDLSDVKASLRASTDEFRQELDSYKKTNDLRANEMAATLDKQRNLISALVQETIVSNTFIANLASTTSTNAAQIAHGDYVVHAQIDYLSRITNSLLRYSNALASTDPRSVVAQPAMSKLFEGYLAVIDYLKNTNDPPMTPILDSRTFNWTEIPLPSNSVRNVVSFTEAYLDTPTLVSILRGFRATTALTCTGFNALRCTSTVSGNPAIFKAYGAAINGDSWIFGPYHYNHIGIYNVFNSTPFVAPFQFFNNMNTFTQVVAQAGSSVASPIAYDTTGFVSSSVGLYCVDFLGYKMLSTFDTTPYMLNGIPAGQPASSLSQCNAYLLRNRFTAAGKKTHFLFGIISGVVVPFYSSCDPATLMADANTTTKFGYLAGFPNPDPAFSTAGVNTSFLYTTYEMNEQHMVGPNCAINMEPEWLGLDYYIPATNTKVIPNVPRGYKLTQFTINPSGELASSLEFLYTQTWAWAYDVRRISNNTIIVDEVDVLDKATVLFHLDGNTVVDESDSFYGEGNNGRDCVRYNTQYEYDITSCFFQNDQTAYTSDQYLAGSIVTSGIARFNNKFDFSFSTTTDTQNVATVPGNPAATVYQFSLKAKADSDFAFSVSSDGSVCPRVLVATSSVSGCQYAFAYSGSQVITFGPDVIRFNPDGTSNITLVKFTDPANLIRSLEAGGKQCALLQCVYGGTADTSTVRVDSPKVQIVSSDDKALRARVSDIISTLNNTINNMSTVQDQVALSNIRLGYIISNLSQLNFNVTKLVPYEDFTALRAQVDSMINNLGSPNTVDCSAGVFSSAACFGKDILNTIIVLVVIALLILLGYVVCFKFGLAKKLCGGK